MQTRDTFQLDLVFSFCQTYTHTQIRIHMQTNETMCDEHKEANHLSSQSPYIII